MLKIFPEIELRRRNMICSQTAVDSPDTSLGLRIAICKCGRHLSLFHGHVCRMYKAMKAQGVRPYPVLTLCFEMTFFVVVVTMGIHSPVREVRFCCIS